MLNCIVNNLQNVYHLAFCFTTSATTVFIFILLFLFFFVQNAQNYIVYRILAKTKIKRFNNVIHSTIHVHVKLFIRIYSPHVVCSWFQCGLNFFFSFLAFSLFLSLHISTFTWKAFNFSDNTKNTTITKPKWESNAHGSLVYLH